MLLAITGFQERKEIAVEATLHDVLVQNPDRGRCCPFNDRGRSLGTTSLAISQIF